MRPALRRSVSLLAATTIVLTACGGGSDDAGDAADDAAVTTVVDVATTDAPATSAADAVEEPAETDAPAETAAEATDTTPADTAPADTLPAETAPADTGDVSTGDAAAGSAEASLVEWAIEAPTEYAAGEVSFTAVNDGSFPHEFVVIEGESYEALPTAEGGAVLEDELPTGALIGRTDTLSAGESADLVVELAPGNYVLVCNLGGGSNSHAGRGQRLDITVG